MTVSAKDIGGRVTDGMHVGVLRDFDPEWMDPASMPNERLYYPQAWVKFPGMAEYQVEPGSLKRVTAGRPS